MAHHHHHHHGPCGHDHAPASYGRAFLIGTGLNTVFIVAEVFFGLRAGSLALLADAGHNVADVLALLLGWGALWLTTRPPSARFTYGLQSTTILSALANAVILLVTVGGIGWQSVVRLAHPEDVQGPVVIAVAALGILVNGGTALMFMAERKGELNARAAYLHMAADAMISLGVVVTGLVIWGTGWGWLDPLASLVISGLIVMGTWSLLRDSLNLALQAVPPGIDPSKVKAWLGALPAVTDVHDLHIWAMSTTETALTAHLLMPAYPDPTFLIQAADNLRHEFGIGHATMQIEVGESAADCDLVTHADR